MGAHFFDFHGLTDGAWPLFLVITIFSATFGKNELFRFLQIPVITGYMIIGFLCGPYVVGLMNLTQVSELSYVNHAALSFIAFSAGAEIYLPEIMPLIKPILWVSCFMITFTMIIGTAFTYGVGGTVLLPWMEGYTACNFGIAMLVATILSARSPTSVLAVVRELKAAGYVTSVMIGITVAGDVFVLTIFAIVQAMTINFCSAETFNGGSFAVNLVMIPAAIFWGYLLGWVLVGLLYIQHGKHLILPIGFFTYLVCDYILKISDDQTDFSIDIDTLLICITAGFVAGNSPKRDELVSYFHELSPYIFIPFFTQVGLQLNLPVLINSLGFSIVASLVRAFCMFLGTTTGGHIVNMDQDKALRLWMGLLPQAGVALGLAGIVGHQFNSSFGKSFQSTVLGVILVNQCIGPVFAKVLIKYCQEDGKSDGTEENALHNVTKAFNDGFLEDHGAPCPIETQTEDRCFELLLKPIEDEEEEFEGSETEDLEAGVEHVEGEDKQDGQDGDNDGAGSAPATKKPKKKTTRRKTDKANNQYTNLANPAGDEEGEGIEMHTRNPLSADDAHSDHADDHRQDSDHGSAGEFHQDRGHLMNKMTHLIPGMDKLLAQKPVLRRRKGYTPGGIRVINLTDEGKETKERDTSVITVMENTLLHTVVQGYTAIVHTDHPKRRGSAPPVPDHPPSEGDEGENPLWWNRLAANVTAGVSAGVSAGVESGKRMSVAFAPPPLPSTPPPSDLPPQQPAWLNEDDVEQSEEQSEEQRGVDV